MKLLLLTITLAASAIASPVTSEQAAARAEPARKFVSNQDELGPYDFEYTTAEGISFKQRGKLVPTADGKHVMEIEGEVSYIGDDGKVYTTKYSAGIEGTKMEGSHLPVAPEVPAAIVAEIYEADTAAPEAASTESPKPESETLMPVEVVVPFEPPTVTDAPSEKISEVILPVEPILAQEKASEPSVETRDKVLIIQSEPEIAVPKELPEIVMPEITNIPEVVLPKESDSVIAVVPKELPEVILPEITNIPEVVLPKESDSAIAVETPEFYLTESETYVPEKEIFTIQDGPIHITQVHIPKSMMRFPEMLQVVPLFLQQLNQ